MGVVYRARDDRLDRDVAIKVLPEGTLTDEAARTRLRKEALALSRLNHPNVATVLDFDEQDGLAFLAMEYVAGPTLTSLIAAGYRDVVAVRENPSFAALRDAPRFQELLRRMGRSRQPGARPARQGCRTIRTPERYERFQRSKRSERATSVISRTLR